MVVIYLFNRVRAVIFKPGKPTSWLNAVHDSCKRAGLKHLLFLILLIGYSVFGGVIFRALEFNEAENEKELRELLKNRRQFLLRLDEIAYEKQENKSQMVNDAVAWYESKAGLTLEQKQSPWTLWGSIFYAATLYTSIGE